ncbi:UNVERIFIED_CONTAM: hypothetical protein FKN15_074560 [Acipenser sinensis]
MRLGQAPLLQLPSGASVPRCTLSPCYFSACGAQCTCCSVRSVLSAPRCICYPVTVALGPLKEKMTTNREVASVALTDLMQKEKWLPQYDSFNPSLGGTEGVIPGRGLSAALV